MLDLCCREASFASDAVRGSWMLFVRGHVALRKQSTCSRQTDQTILVNRKQPVYTAGGDDFMLIYASRLRQSTNLLGLTSGKRRSRQLFQRRFQALAALEHRREKISPFVESRNHVADGKVVRFQSLFTSLQSSGVDTGAPL
jgi:hypothetical protein